MFFTLFGRSVLVLALLFGLLFAVLMGLGEYFGFSIYVILLFAIFVVGLQYLISPFIIQWIYRVNWVGLDGFGPETVAFIEQTCSDRKIPIPRLGVIDDGNPNAFTFGHFPGDARLVVTRGLLEKLNPREVNSVIGHELGHIKHWDFVIMTIASLVPIIFYIIFRGMLSAGRGSRKNGGYALIIALVSFIIYIISQYIVLFLSRVREYYADEFSAQVTGDPNQLASSLVKIAYGLSSSAGKSEKENTGFRQLSATKALGVFDPTTARALAVAAAGAGGFTQENMENAMKWDLWNPWAKFFELGSTHPLPAKRIIRLESIAEKWGQAPAYTFRQVKPESYWDEFFADIFMNSLPWLGFFLTLIIIPVLFFVNSLNIGYGLGLGFTSGVLVGGLLSLLKTRFKYRKAGFPETTVAKLVSEVKVSHIRPVPATLKGKFIGRGIPGLMWSDDLVLQDESGFVVVNYRQPLAILEFLFGLFRAAKLVGGDATVVGWYRRSPMPYLEMYKIITSDKTRKAYVYGSKLFFAWLCALLGAILTIVVFVSAAGAVKF